VTLAERWNGTSWKVQSTPNAHAHTNQLDGVSCKAADACTAVGYYDTDAYRSIPLAEHWNGTSWKIQPTPRPADPGRFSTRPSGVACTAANGCTAVGYGAKEYAREDGISQTFAMRRTP
jgi:hypothetical protein